MQYDDSLFSEDPAPKQPAASANMDASLFSDEPAPANEKSLGGLAHNAVADAGNIVSSTANLAGNMIAHPIDTTKQVVTNLPAGLKAWAQELGVPEALHGQFGDALKKFGESAYEKPVSRALDVASVAMPALKGAGLVGEGAEAAELAQKGGKLAEMAGDASNALGRRELGFTKRLLGNSEKMDKANEATEWANKNGLMDVLDSPNDRLAKAKGLKDQAWDTMGTTYGDPALAGKNLGSQNLIDALEAKRPRDPAGNVLRGGDWDALNNEIDNKIDTIKAFKGDIPWNSAQDLKNRIKAATNWDTTKSSDINNFRKTLSGAFRENMDTQLADQLGKDNPAMAAYNTAKNDYGMSKNVIRALENRISSKAGNRILGPSDFLVGGAEAIHGGGLSALAVVGAKKMIERYGLAAGSKMLSQLAGGKYSGLLGHLSAFGPAEMATVNMIAEHDPDFAKELAATGAQQ